MAIANIKSDFHHLIDKIDNEELLKAFYALLSGRVENATGQLWQSLTEAEQKELLLAEEESKKPENLISDKEAKQTHLKWLKK